MGALDSDRDRLAAGPNQLYPTLCGPDDRFATDIEQCTKMGIVIDFDGTLSYLARFAKKNPSFYDTFYKFFTKIQDSRIGPFASRDEKSVGATEQHAGCQHCHHLRERNGRFEEKSKSQHITYAKNPKL